MCSQVEEMIVYVVCIAFIPLTMRYCFPAARHDAVTQLDDFGDADYLLGVVTLIRQQHQEEKDVGNDGLRVSVRTRIILVHRSA